MTLRGLYVMVYQVLELKVTLRNLSGSRGQGDIQRSFWHREHPVDQSQLLCLLMANIVREKNWNIHLNPLKKIVVEIIAFSGTLASLETDSG